LLITASALFDWSDAPILALICDNLDKPPVQSALCRRASHEPRV
jgi:hypothetical protein